MTRIEQLKDQIDELNHNIEQGEKFEAQGCDCGMMLAMTESIRNRLRRELAELEAQQ